MGQYVESLKATIRDHMNRGKSDEKAYAFLLDKLHSAMKACESSEKELFAIGDAGGILDPEQMLLFHKLEEVRTAISDMILDLNLLRNDHWKP